MEKHDLIKLRSINMKKIISLILVLSLLVSSFSSTAFAYYTEEDCKNDDTCTIYTSGKLNLENGKLIYVPAEKVINAFEQIVLEEKEFEDLKEMSPSHEFMAILGALGISSAITFIHHKKMGAPEEIAAIKKELRDNESLNNNLNNKKITDRISKALKKLSIVLKNRDLPDLICTLINDVLLFFSSSMLIFFWSKIGTEAILNHIRNKMPQNLNRIKNYLRAAIMEDSHVTLSFCDNQIGIQTNHMSLYYADCREFKIKE